MQENIIVRGAREHNLKNINVEIPRDKMVVITGLSGSGKSSLAFDTIYAEGQRRYVESLSSYARQFLGQKEKPDLDSISGLSPAVSIDQKTTSRNPRSTVGTVTEIYDYLRLLFARVGTPHCPVCGKAITKQTTDQVADSIMAARKTGRIIVLAPVIKGRKGEYIKLLDGLRAQGFTRVRIDGEIRELADEISLNKKVKHDIDVVTDRLQMKPGIESRLAEAIETATTLSDGTVIVQFLGDKREVVREETYSLALACPEHDYSIDELNPRDFSFNAPYGACPECMGIGSRREIDPDRIIPDPKLSLSEGACVAISMRSNYAPQVINAACEHLGVSMDTPWCKYSAEVKRQLLYGIKEKVMVYYHSRDGRHTHWTFKWEGLVAMVEEKYHQTNSDHTRARYEAYYATIACNVCHGTRLKPSVLAVTVGGKNIY